MPTWVQWVRCVRRQMYNVAHRAWQKLEYVRDFLGSGLSKQSSIHSHYQAGELTVAFLTSEQKEITEDIARLLVERKETIGVAESSTGGLVSAALLSVSGASAYFLGGGVLYTIASRLKLVGMPESAFANYTGPS